MTPRGVETYAQWHPELEKFVEANYLAYLPAREGDLQVIPWWGGVTNLDKTRIGTE